MNRFSRAPSGRLAHQDGIVLLIALVVLVAMTLAGVALVRSVETGNMVAGNLAFKQGATLAGDAAMEAAIDWLEPMSISSAVYKDVPSSGYYATSQDLLDRTGQRNDPARALVDWDNNNCNGLPNSNCIRPSAAVTVGDNSISYIIHRLCKHEGDPNESANSCVSYESKISGSSKRGEIKAGEDKRFSALPVPYYRITSRIKGPRNTVSFVETMVHF
ncbi:MAG: pilX2 [Noviherbaspirillum sp.]|nr:pilX2 [Noviherbaspirillum sp.]